MSHCLSNDYDYDYAPSPHHASPTSLATRPARTQRCGVPQILGVIRPYVTQHPSCVPWLPCRPALQPRIPTPPPRRKHKHRVPHYTSNRYPDTHPERPRHNASGAARHQSVSPHLRLRLPSPSYRAVPPGHRANPGGVAADGIQVDMDHLKKGEVK